MYKLLSINKKKNMLALEYIVDTELEKSNIPSKHFKPFTRVYVIESGKWYRLDSNLNWHEQGGA